ncbi:hypothetical protein [Dawidia soli]|uniref:Uncharacterized protein n=1 Tax=Dawidia soli TaxID=2782352 RepID=A0AAP2GHV6_9BACT|nr:hypothetical protein [Dawidia soli]MBT1687591.1 hypothetical protein [Dawidia soli]
MQKCCRSFVRVLGLFLVFITMAMHAAVAQEQELKPVDDTSTALGSLFGGNASGITAVKVVANTEQSITLQVSVKGIEGDATSLSGAVLNKLKKPLADFVCEPRKLPAGDGTAELKFQFKQGNAAYKSGLLETHFVSLTLAKKEGILGSLDLGDDVLGDNTVYAFQKKWRVSGSASMVIPVVLMPFKSAATLKP